MDAVSTAFAAVPRELFLPKGARFRADFDAPIQIGHGQTNSQPHTVANMLRLLEIEPGQRVLDVGSGSGWTTALLAELVGPSGSVVGVERVPELTRWGAANLAGTPHSWASIQQACQETLGWPELAPYDRILVSADATELPEQLLDQLSERGRLVLPVRGTMILVTRSADGDQITEHGSYRFVPLV